MEVLLAGMNIDSELLQEIIKSLRKAAISLDSEKNPDDKKLAEKIFNLLDADNITPETIAAAYARISRDPRPVDQLREDSRLRIGKARRSNRKIIFGLGHSSVAEHAVFNLDIIGITRYLSEYIQAHRLCSFTEKSQRYIRQNQDYFIPDELRSSSLKDEYIDFIKRRFNDYNELSRILHEDLGHDPELCGEDARYVLPLAVTTQMGMTTNARNLEKLLQQAASSNLSEFRSFGAKLFNVIEGVAPSLVKYTQASSAESDRRKHIKTMFFDADKTEKHDSTPENVKLIHVTPDGDQIVALAYIASANGASIINKSIASIIENNLQSVFLKIFETMEPWESPPREFEYAEIMFELVISAAAYAQLKRHRMATIVTGDYDANLGLTVPPALKNSSGEKIIREAFKESNELADKIQLIAPSARSYAFLACHRRRLLIKMNARELIHLSRLREDIHAQWDIRELSSKMIRLARKKIPGCMILACGKHLFSDYKSKLNFS